MYLMLTSTCVLLVVADNEAYVDRHFIAGRFLHRAGTSSRQIRDGVIVLRNRTRV